METFGIYILSENSHKIISQCSCLCPGSHDLHLLTVAAGGHFGAVKYAVTFAAAGTALDYAALKLSPQINGKWHALKEHFSGDKDWFTLPEWSPIQVLDEEALAKKRAREEKLFAQRALSKLSKEEP